MAGEDVLWYHRHGRRAAVCAGAVAVKIAVSCVSMKKSDQVIRMVIRLAFCAACTIAAGRVAATEGGVYVADQGIPIDQAFHQALAENPGKPGEPFWVIVADADVARVTKEKADQDILAWVKRVRERGGIIYVCRSDLMRHGIEEEQLLDGVTQVYGYGTEDRSGLPPIRKEELVLPESTRQSRLILKTCADDDQPEPY